MFSHNPHKQYFNSLWDFSRLEKRLMELEHEIIHFIGGEQELEQGSPVFNCLTKKNKKTTNFEFRLIP